jgi:ParB family chromosome partitioning protein
MSALQYIPIEQLVEGDNPRGEINEGTESFQELCGSIEEHGVLQSILVAQAQGESTFTIVAGHRRYRAAKKVGKKEMPALVSKAEGAHLTQALIENVQREDLSPIAEARAIRQLREEYGLTQVQAAGALNKSERWARDRERLLGLPERTQEAFDERVLPMEKLSVIEAVAETAPLVADAIAEAATSSEIKDAIRDDIVGGRTHEAIDKVARRAAEKPNADGTSRLGCLIPLNGLGSRYEITRQQLELAGVPESMKEELEARLAVGAKLARKTSMHLGYFDRVVLDGSDVDAANSYGCLLSVEGRKYIADAAWLSDRFLERLNETMERAEKRLSKMKGGGSGTSDTQGELSAEDEALAREVKREERELEAENRLRIRANNLELGQRASKELKAPSLSIEEEKLLALKVIGSVAPELAASGLVYCYHEYQDADGAKVAYAGGRAAGEDLVAQIKSSRKRGEPLGHALRALLLSQFADEACVAPSNRNGYLPTTHADPDLPDLLETIAEKRKVLPDEVKDEMQARRQARAERVEGQLLTAAKASRAKTGIKLSLLLSGPVTQASVDAAITAKHLKEHEGDEFSYTMTAAGKKRLEKLKAAEKERDGGQ